MALARYSGVAQDADGNALPGATVTVRRQRSGKPMAAIKLDREGISPKFNPFMTEPDGSFFFHAIGDIYEITVAKGGDSFVREYVGIGTASEYDLDALLTGKRQQVRVATTGNITISTALNNGDVIDGVTLANGDLVLVKDQTSAAQNGVYVVGAVPARSVEFDTYDEHAGAMVAVASGTANALALFFCTANAGGTLNTTAIDFTKLQSTAGPQGDPGPPGADGDDGAPGAPGASGADGAAMRHGSGAPSGMLGNDDDFYIDTTNHLLYGPKAGGSWGVPTPTTAGPKGDQGDPGADGDDGAPGNPGADGDDGWSPVFANESDGARRVMRVVNWVGGSGTKPATGMYVGATGFEALIANAVDIRGAQGAPGSGSGDMQEATYDPDGDGKFANAQLDDMAQGTVKMRRAGVGSGSPTDTTLANLKADLALNNVTNDAQLPLSYLDTDASLAANSDVKIASQKAVRAFVASAVAALVASSPAALDTLDELAAALGDDPNFATTMATALGNRLRVDTAAQGLNGTQQGNALTNLGATTLGKALIAVADAAALRTAAGLGNVDNTSDATKNAAAATLANKIISGANNTLSAIASSSLTSLLVSGFTATSGGDGTKSSGTYTPDPSTGNFKHITNGGAFTLAPPSAPCTMIVEILNNGSAGAITVTGFTKINGDLLTTVNGSKFVAVITKTQSYSLLTIQALQ